MSWHEQLAGRVASLLAAPTWIHGSMARADHDAVSDLDLVAQVEDPTAWTIESLDPLGARWTWQCYVDDDGVVHRVVFVDGCWLDLRVVTADAELPEPRLSVAAVASTDVSGTGVAPAAKPQVCSEQVQRARFLAALASAKFIRHDQLIGGHLLLDLARVSLEIAMVRRDDAAGTSHHRFGGPFNEVWDQALDALPTEASLAGQLTAVTRLLAVVDETAGQPGASAPGLAALHRRLLS